MKVRYQLALGVVFLLVLLAWVFWQLVLPWLQRTLSEPDLESSAWIVGQLLANGLWR